MVLMVASSYDRECFVLADYTGFMGWLCFGGLLVVF